MVCPGNEQRSFCCFGDCTQVLYPSILVKLVDAVCSWCLKWMQSLWGWALKPVGFAPTPGSWCQNWSELPDTQLVMENWLLENETVILPTGKHQFIILKHCGCNNLVEIMVVYYLKTEKTLKKSVVGPACWLSGKECPCQCRRHRLSLWSGKIPHAAEQLIPWAMTAEPVFWSLGAAVAGPSCPSYWRLCALEPALRNEKSYHHGEPGHCQEGSSPFVITREKSPRQGRPSPAKNREKETLIKKKYSGKEKKRIRPMPYYLYIYIVFYSVIKVEVTPLCGFYWTFSPKV